MTRIEFIVVVIKFRQLNFITNNPSEGCSLNAYQIRISIFLPVEESRSVRNHLYPVIYEDLEFEP